MKKRMIAAVVTAAIACVGLQAGCAWGGGQAGSSPSQEAATSKYQVVCATFPAYDWTMQVLGERADDYEVTYLMDSGVDLHSFQPTVEDMAKIANADLFVYVGGESDEWAKDAVEAAGSKDLRTLSMLEAVGDAAVEEEIVEGMQAEEEEESEGEEEGPEYDEHVWLSLRNAPVLVDAIASELAAIDPEGAETYVANARAYNAALADLDGRYFAAVKAGT